MPESVWLSRIKTSTTHQSTDLSFDSQTPKSQPRLPTLVSRVTSSLLPPTHTNCQSMASRLVWPTTPLPTPLAFFSLDVCWRSSSSTLSTPEPRKLMVPSTMLRMLMVSQEHSSVSWMLVWREPPLALSYSVPWREPSMVAWACHTGI